MEFKIVKFYSNYILQADTIDGAYNLWKDGTVHQYDLGLDAVVESRGYVGEGKYARFGEKNFSLAPGYYPTYKEAESYLSGYLAKQESIKPISTPNLTLDEQEWDTSPMTAEQIKNEFGIELYDEETVPEKCFDCSLAKVCWPDVLLMKL